MLLNTKGLGVFGISVTAILFFFNLAENPESTNIRASILHLAEDMEQNGNSGLLEDLNQSETSDYESLPSLFSNVNIYKRITNSINTDNESTTDQNYLSLDQGIIIKNSFAYSKDLATALAQEENVSTFVIVEEFKQLDSDYYWLDYELRTPFGSLEVNSDLGTKTSESELQLSETEKRSLAANTFSPLLKHYFPNAKVRLLLVGTDLDDSSLTVLSEQLNSEQDVYMISISEAATGVDARVAKLQNSYLQNVIETLDYEAVQETNVTSPSAIKVLLKFLQNKAIAEGLKLGSERKLYILAFGDMMLGRYVRTLMDQAGDKNYIFENIEGENGKFFRGVDLIHGNLEGPIKGQGKSGGTAMNFAFNIDIAPFLKSKGFDLLSLANNHAVDQGWEGRDTTIEALENADLDWCGHPSEADPESVYYNSVGWGENELSYAFVCLHDVTFKLDTDAAVKLIEKVNEEVDLVIVSIHWGYEYHHTADQNVQVDKAHRFIDAGADFIIGHHPHVVQNFEEYKGKYIFYSLGNFVFDQYWSQATQEELAIGIVIDEDETEIYLIPMKSEMSQSRLMTPEESKVWIEKFLEYGEYTKDVKEKVRLDNLI